MYLRNAVVIGVLFASLRYASAASDGEAFRTPKDAASNPVAAKADDTDAMLKILGPSAHDIVVSGDPVADKNARHRFVERAEQRLRIVSDPRETGKKVIEIGKDDWLLPIPLVQSGDKWRFDVDAGKGEILLRRIGDNELSAIEIMHGYVEAQHEYSDRAKGSGHTPQYAQRGYSTPGKHDGLYWESQGPNDESPAGEAIAKAMAQGYAAEVGQPLYGYHFRILTSQGPNAPGGAMSYIENGVMTKGFAMIAWPADYGSTGVMTFQGDRSGIVFQKDLGEETAAVAAKITA